MTVPENDIAALFDPKLDDPVPVIPPGALPPSWAAMQSHAPQPVRAWSEAEPAHAPDGSEYDHGEDDTDGHTSLATDPDHVADKVLGRQRRRTGKKRAKSATDRDKAAAKKRADRERKAVRLKLTGTSANITRTATTSTAWFVQRQGPWNFRTTGKQRRFIQDEAIILTNLQKAGVNTLHRRLVRTPFPVAQWAVDHDTWATPIPDVPGALSWADYLRGQQHAMLWSNATIKGRYWGIELPQRSSLGQGLDWTARMLRHLAHWPLLGRVCAGVNRWADDAFEREQKALADHLATLERIMSGRGVKATPATPAAIDYLLRRSATIGLPLEAGGAIAGAGDWEETDVAALEDLTDLSLTPGDGYTTVSGVVDGRKYTGVVIVLTIGRMAPLPIPERMLPWQIIGDPSGEPLEWSDRIELHDKAKTIRTMRSLTGKIESQFDHYTVEHDQVPPKELAEQHARAQDVISDVEEDHSGLSTRTTGWYRLAVVGTDPDDARQKVSDLQEMYSPHIALEQEHGQYQLLREFIPGEPQANIANKRHMDVEAVAAGMATVSDRIGDRRGVVLGETGSISPRPVIWDLFAAHEIKHKSGLTPIVAVPGSGKTFLAGMIVYQAVRAGAYGVVLDPSGPLAALAGLPEFRDIARVYALTGRDSRAGALNPYRVITDPRRDDPEYDARNVEFARDSDPFAAAQSTFDADMRAAAAERVEVAVSVLKMMLTERHLHLEHTEPVLHMAANMVGGDSNHNLREVLAAIQSIGVSDPDQAVKTCANGLYQQLSLMSELTEARVLFPEEGTIGSGADAFDADIRLTILTMPGLQLPPEGTPSSQWTPQQRMTAPLMHMAAWLANRLVYEKPRHVRKVLFLDENKYLESTGAGRTLNLRIARDSRKFKVRALVCSQLPDDFLGLDGSDDKTALTYEVFVGDVGGDPHAIEGALKLLKLPTGQGFEQFLAELGSGGEDTLDEDTDTSYQDEARRWMIRMADDVELVRSSWIHYVHLAHVFAALNSSSAKNALGGAA
ncbi:ATP-binding protein [Rhodococcus erythropolis]|uniref:ATP-binding protein n=1 Tax=Rhodococcus erythropolis TaxID=1833 RepID=UPI001BEBD5B1|nr:ATP-binding protein [Rhodococcus erythropolis]MBT2266021.1 ATP-binding protein [Rhodococcus erythropolis]